MSASIYVAPGMHHEARTIDGVGGGWFEGELGGDDGCGCTESRHDLLFSSQSPGDALPLAEIRTTA